MNRNNPDMIKNKVILLLFLTIVYTNSFTQEFTIHFGPCIPMASFNGTSSNGLITLAEGSADPGFVVGAKYIMPINYEYGLGINFGVDFNYNEFNASNEGDIYKLFPNSRISYTKFITIPISVGLNHSISVNSDFRIITNANVVLSFLDMPNQTIDSYDKIAVEKFGLSKNLGYKIGFGFVMWEKINLDFNYFSLGNHNFDSKLTVSEVNNESTENISRELNMDVFNMTVSLNF